MKKQYKKGLRTQISKNFWSTEMDCKCKDPECKWTIIETEHIKKLQTKRNKWRKSIEITSGYRCESHNKRVGGVTNSAHRRGEATDIKVKGMAPDAVADDCENFKGLGRYDSFTHIDSRDQSYKSRWDFRRKKPHE